MIVSLLPTFIWIFANTCSVISFLYISLKSSYRWMTNFFLISVWLLLAEFHLKRQFVEAYLWSHLCLENWISTYSNKHRDIEEVGTSLQKVNSVLWCLNSLKIIVQWCTDKDCGTSAICPLILQDFLFF